MVGEKTQHAQYLRHLEKKASEAGAGRAVGQITDGSGELGKRACRVQKASFRRCVFGGTRAKGTLGLKKGGSVVTFQF